jgi:hypothetical protein
MTKKSTKEMRYILDTIAWQQAKALQGMDKEELKRYYSRMQYSKTVWKREKKSRQRIRA